MNLQKFQEFAGLMRVMLSQPDMVKLMIDKSDSGI